MDSTVRVVAINLFTPTSEVYEDPFLVDTRSQLAACSAWAAKNGLTINMQSVVSGLESRLFGNWLDADILVAPARRVLERAVASVPDLLAACVAAGVRVEIADEPEPDYTRDMIADVYREHSLQGGHSYGVRA